MLDENSVLKNQMAIREITVISLFEPLNHEAQRTGRVALQSLDVLKPDTSGQDQEEALFALQSRIQR